MICEEVTYSGTIGAYRTLGIDMVGIGVDEDGMRVEFLEETLDGLGEARKPKFIYALTTYQNPTGTNLSLERRHRLIEIARARDIPIIEDNCYGDVHYDGDKPPALYGLTDYENIIYMCSLSKILAPGMRLGYLYAQPRLLETILARRHDAGGNYLAAAVVAELYRDGVWSLTEELNDSLKVKKNLVVDGLADAAGDICASSNPSGGLFVWVRFPDDVDQAKLAQACSGARVLLRLGRELPHPRRRGSLPAASVRTRARTTTSATAFRSWPNACARRARATKRRHSRGSSTKTTAKRPASSGQTGCKSASSKSSLVASADSTASSLKIRIASAGSKRLPASAKSSLTRTRGAPAASDAAASHA